jgi:hypothetical protein
VCILPGLGWTVVYTLVVAHTPAVDKPPEEVHNMNVLQVRQLRPRPMQALPNSYYYSTHYYNTHGHDIRDSMQMQATKWLHQSGTMLQVTSS